MDSLPLRNTRSVKVNRVDILRAQAEENNRKLKDESQDDQIETFRAAESLLSPRSKITRI